MFADFESYLAWPVADRLVYLGEPSRTFRQYFYNPSGWTTSRAENLNASFESSKGVPRLKYRSLWLEILGYAGFDRPIDLTIPQDILIAQSRFLLDRLSDFELFAGLTSTFWEQVPGGPEFPTEDRAISSYDVFDTDFSAFALALSSIVDHSWLELISSTLNSDPSWYELGSTWQHFYAAVAWAVLLDSQHNTWKIEELSEHGRRYVSFILQYVMVCHDQARFGYQDDVFREWDQMQREGIQPFFAVQIRPAKDILPEVVDLTSKFLESWSPDLRLVDSDQRIVLIRLYSWLQLPLEETFSHPFFTVEIPEDEKFNLERDHLRQGRIVTYERRNDQLAANFGRTTL